LFLVRLTLNSHFHLTLNKKNNMMLLWSDKMLVNSNKILDKARKENYAVPQFNIQGVEWTRYILEVAEELRSPVILGISEGGVKYVGGYKTVFNMVTGLLEDLNITVPVVLHLDHDSKIESTVESCKQAINNGFSSVMLDASHKHLTENIKMTKEVVLYAKPKGVSVESEVGPIGTSDDDLQKNLMYAEVEDCVKLVKETGVDSLAPALGSVHGLYKGLPQLDFDRMRQIDQEVAVPLVLHGGSGIPDEMIKKAIKSGIAKININTELKIAWSEQVKEYVKENEETNDPRRIISAGKEGIKKIVREKLCY
jgi:fructose-bisphosphate aldolase, class II